MFHLDFTKQVGINNIVNYLIIISCTNIDTYIKKRSIKAWFINCNSFFMSNLSRSITVLPSKKGITPFRVKMKKNLNIRCRVRQSRVLLRTWLSCNEIPAPLLSKKPHRNHIYPSGLHMTQELTNICVTSCFMMMRL